jgi:cyclic beta-1,2-glucan synthetase
LWLVQALVHQGRTDDALAILDLIAPSRHAATSEDVARYRVEPYVVAADVYGTPPHMGRGGWSWYTGSAAWMYRVILESLLGFQLQGNRLRLNPKLATDWPGFEITFRRGRTTWQFSVRRQSNNETDVADAVRGEIELVDDGKCHKQIVLVTGN